MSKEIQILVDYVEGRLNISEFRKEFLHNESLKKKLRSRIRMDGDKWCNYKIYEYISKQINPMKNNWDNVAARYIVWIQLCIFLEYNKISFQHNYLKYDNDYDYLLDIQPSWLDIHDDQGIFDKIIAECPKELSKTKRIAWGKAQLKELFKYDKTYPRWVQDPEWPIVDGIPLVFSHQSKEKKDDEHVYFYFYHPQTKEETVVMQLY